MDNNRELIILTLYCLFCVPLCSADGLKAEVVFDLLSRRFDFFAHEINVIKSDVTNIKNGLNDLEVLKQKFERLEAEKKYMDDETISEKKNTRPPYRRYASAAQRMLSTEKKIIRQNFEKLEERFKEMQSGVLSKLNLTEDALNKTIGGLVQEFTEHKIDTSIALSEQRNETDAKLAKMNDSLAEHKDKVLETFEEVRKDAEGTSNDFVNVERRLNTIVKYEFTAISNQIGALQSIQGKHQSIINRQDNEIDSLESRISSEESYTVGLSKRIAKEEERKIAFSATLKTKRSYYIKNQDIVFDDVKYKHGDGYDSSTGIFTAPKSGTYLFMFNIESTTNGIAKGVLKVRGYAKASALVEKGANYNGGNACVAYLYKGDKAWVEVGDYRDRYYVYPHRTQFNGVLID